MPNITAADVRAWAKTSHDDIVIEPVIKAVEELLGDEYDVPSPTPERVKLAEKMQVARLLRRAQTPEGVAQFGSELAIRISRFDPDIDRLLRSFALSTLGEA